MWNLEKNFKKQKIAINVLDLEGTQAWNIYQSTLKTNSSLSLLLIMKPPHDLAPFSEYVFSQEFHNLL